MACDVVTSDEPQHVASGERQARTPRLARNEQRGARGSEREERLELTPLEMMQKEIGDERIARGALRAEPLRGIRNRDCHTMTAAFVFRDRFGAHHGLSIDEYDFGALHLGRLPKGAQEQRAISSAKLGNARRRGAQISRERIAQKTGMAHDPVDGTQIAPAARGARVVQGQVVEPFPLDTP